MTTFPPLWIETLRAVRNEIREEDAEEFSEDNWNPDAHAELTLTVRECRNLIEMLKVMEQLNSGLPKSKR